MNSKLKITNRRRSPVERKEKKVKIFSFGYTSRGITLPKYETEGLNWVTGDKLRFSIDGKRMILEKDDTHV